MLALNLETVKPANFTTVNGERLPLFKSRYTSNLSPVHVSDYMSGKMEGIPSISTNCLENPVCRARMENGESVCAHCFAAATLDRYTAAGVHAANNLQILTWQVLPLDLFFNAAALDAFMSWLISEDPAAANADRDEIDAVFDEWTGYTAGDMIDEAMKTGRSAAYGYTVEVSADERPYTVMHDGVVEC